jgi:hypothetical protein
LNVEILKLKLKEKFQWFYFKRSFKDFISKEVKNFYYLFLPCNVFAEEFRHAA